MGRSAVGRSAFLLSFIQRQHSEARSTDCEMFPGRNCETLPGSYLRQFTYDHRWLVRTDLTVKLTLTESPAHRRCFSRQTQSRQVWCQSDSPQMYLYVVLQKMPLFSKYFWVPHILRQSDRAVDVGWVSCADIKVRVMCKEKQARFSRVKT